MQYILELRKWQEKEKGGSSWQTKLDYSAAETHPTITHGFMFNDIKGFSKLQEKEVKFLLSFSPLFFTWKAILEWKIQTVWYQRE